MEEESKYSEEQEEQITDRQHLEQLSEYSSSYNSDISKAIDNGEIEHLDSSQASQQAEDKAVSDAKEKESSQHSSATTPAARKEFLNLRSLSDNEGGDKGTSQAEGEDDDDEYSDDTEF